MPVKYSLWLTLTLVDPIWIGSKLVDENCPNLCNKCIYISMAWSYSVYGIIGLQHKVTIFTGSCIFIVHFNKYLSAVPFGCQTKLATLFYYIYRGSDFLKMFILNEYMYKLDFIEIFHEWMITVNKKKNKVSGVYTWGMEREGGCTQAPVLFNRLILITCIIFIGTPAVNKLEQTFKSRLSLNQFMMEFQSLVKTASSGDICPRIFRQEPDHPGQFTQYNPFRKPLHVSCGLIYSTPRLVQFNFCSFFYAVKVSG